MNPFSTLSNVSWACRNLFSEDDRARIEARQIVIDLGLIESYDEFSVCEYEEQAVCDRVLERAHKLDD